MTMKVKNILALSALTLIMASCSLDETNYSALDQNTVYTSEEGFNGLVNACYENIYYLYGKLDGIPMMEMGTDLWRNGSRNGSNGDLTNYNEDLTTNTGTVKTVWNALYATVAYCNTAIYYKQNFPDSTMASKVAEAYFLRAFCNWHIVEQWGGVVLNTTSIAQNGGGTEKAYRSSEEDFYNQIVSDLKYAAKYLPEVQTERGRANKYAAYAMLAKTYLQRTRLYPEGDAKRVAYADSAFDAAKVVIDHMQLYPSDATSSGSTKYWDPENNKNNQENIFVEAVDHVGGHNPEFWNRGRTGQYYEMAIGNAAQNFGISSDGFRYRRANAGVWKPTLYLLQSCFDPHEDTPDTRFSDSFYYKYYIHSSSFAISYSNWVLYGKDPSRYNTRRSSSYTIKGNVLTPTELAQQHPGYNYYADQGTCTADYFEMEDKDEAMGCFTPNWDLDSAQCAKVKYLAAGPNTYMDKTGDGPDGKIGGNAKNSYFRSLQPSLKKFSCPKYLYTNQYSMQDIAIIRLTDIYLTAAEATIISGHNENQGLAYLNAVRHHAALSTNAYKMTVGMESMNIDFILKERARELCGEQWRWYDLKRTGRLTKEYLTQPGMDPYITNFSSKFLVRPIPQQFLDQLANADEFGTNGY